MIIVRIELYSAQTGKVSEIGRLAIANDQTGTKIRGNYDVTLMRRKRMTVNNPEGVGIQGHARAVLKRARVEDHPRLSSSVWRLVRKALNVLDV